MSNDTLLPFALPAICRKKVTAAFDGGRLTSDGGVLLLSGADKQRIHPVNAAFDCQSV